jgi:hypothetical protein
MEPQERGSTESADSRSFSALAREPLNHRCTDSEAAARFSERFQSLSAFPIAEWIGSNVLAFL